MRRLRDRQSATLFRGGELPKLFTLVMMLFVIAMMMRKAADTDTWRVFTGESRRTAEPPVAETIALAEKQGQDVKPVLVKRKPKELPPGLEIATEPPLAEPADAAPISALIGQQLAGSELDRPIPVGKRLAPAAGSATSPKFATGPANPSALALNTDPAAAPATSDAAETAPTAPESTAPESTAPESTPAAAAAEDAAPPPVPAPEASEGAAAPEAEPAEPQPITNSTSAHQPYQPVPPEPGSQAAQDAAAADAAANGPLDEEPSEREAFEEEAQAITDRSPLHKEEMFAYWRLLQWEQSQTAPEMLKRARSKVQYGDLIEHPEKYRGELIKAKLHIRRVLKFDDLPENPLDLKTEYQAVGWNDASQSWFYFCVFTDLPEGMPIGEHVYEEGTFVGYFLKTITYLDGQGKRIMAPVLIGRMVWHSTPPTRITSETEWIWPWVAIGVLGVLFAVRWGWRFARGGIPATSLKGVLRRVGPPGDEEEEIDVEQWLEQVETQLGPEAINPDGGHELNGNAAHHRNRLRPNDRPEHPDLTSPDHGLDWTEDREG